MKHAVSTSPLVSIIMPAYNVERYIGEAIESVQSQTFGDFELIIINDGSSDSTRDVAAEYAETDPRIRLYSQRNRGLSAARNRGTGLASGRYIYFFDSDDLLRPEMLEICIKYAERYDLDLVAFSGEVFFEKTVVQDKHFAYQRPSILEISTGQKLLQKLVSQNAYTCSVCLYLFKANLFSEIPLRFDDGYVHEDEGFTPLLFACAGKAISLENILFKRRIREDSMMTASNCMLNVEGRIQAVVKIGEFCDSCYWMEPAFRFILRQKQRRLLRFAAHTAEEIGCYQEFITLVRLKFSSYKLLVTDPMAIVYIWFSNFYFGLRSIKKRLIGVLK